MMLILRGKRLGFRLREIKEYLDLYEVDVTQREQLRLLLKSVRARLAGLAEQRLALEQTVAELTDIEAEAVAALETTSASRREKAAERAAGQRIEE